MGTKLITPKTRTMKALMEEIAGANKMRLQKELNRVTAMEIQCFSDIRALATAQDRFGQMRRNSNMCCIMEEKELCDLALFKGMKTLHISGTNKNTSLYPHKWSDSIENLLVDSYDLFVGLIPYLERLVNLKRLSVRLEGKTPELPQKVKERLEFFVA